MKENKAAVCPGCDRHCTEGEIRCKRGRAYFEKLNRKNAQETPRAAKRKWEKHVEKGGALWTLLFVSRRIKKALKDGSVTEAQLTEILSEQERVELTEILHRLDGKLKQ